MHEKFHRFSAKTAAVTGSSWAFVVAVVVILVWAVTGPVFGFSNTWQLVINTGTTIVTFLMVFLIQNTQNRDALAVHLKLDELIKSTESARDRLIDLEDCTDEELSRLAEEFKRIRDERFQETGDPALAERQAASEIEAQIDSREGDLMRETVRQR